MWKYWIWLNWLQRQMICRMKKLSLVFAGFSILALLGISWISPNLQEPEIRWIKSDTRETVGTVLSSNEKLVELKLLADTSISVDPIKGMIYYGPTIAEEVRIVSFEITFIRPDLDTLTQTARGAYFPSNMMSILKTARPGDSFSISKIRVEGPSGIPVNIRRNYIFRITYS
jgi:hypothetical protein